VEIAIIRKIENEKFSKNKMQSVMTSKIEDDRGN
jgi:hypothetical protein